MSILIIDPHIEELAQLKSELESEGYEDVVATESVPEALDHYDVTYLGNLPAHVELILMDLTVTGAGRFGFPTGPRPSRSTGRPVLLRLVNQSDPVGIKQAEDAGALDVVCRPVLKAELMMRVRSALAVAVVMAAAAKTEAALEVALAAKTRELDRIVSRNTEVLSLASHELKTPLANLSGYVDLILLDWERHGPPSNKQQRQLEAVQRNGFRMDALVNDIMAMAKIKSGTLELSPKELDLARELEGVLGYLQGQLDEKRITVNLVAPVTMTWVRADELRLSQIMVNLLGNACKYSSSDSSITLEVRAGERFAQIDVTDTGCGISQYDQGNLFCQFHRAKTPSAQAVSGTGLGLGTFRANWTRSA